MTITFKHSLVRNGKLIPAGEPVEVNPSELDGFKRAGFRYDDASADTQEPTTKRSAQVLTKRKSA